MQPPANFYRQQINEFTSKLSITRKKLLYLSLLRLITFLSFIIGVYLLINTGNYNAWYLIILAAAAFIFLLRFFADLRTTRELIVNMLFINRNEINISERKPNQFYNGEQAVRDAIYADDLDVFGTQSLFHFLNRCTTPHGERALAGLLNDPLHETNSIMQNQHAVRTIASQPHATQVIIARGLSVKVADADISGIERWLLEASHLLHKRWLTVIRFLMPVLTFAAFIYYLDADNPIPFGSCVLINWLIVGAYLKYIHSQHTMIGKKEDVLHQYASILREFLNLQDNGAGILQRLQLRSRNGNMAIKQLSRLSSAFDQRLNLLVNLFLNSFLLYDLHCTVALEQWKEKHRHDFEEWINTVGEIEMLVSLGVFAYNHPHYTYPELLPGKPCIQASGLAHPLIPSEESVANDIHAGNGEERLLLITGSNMSGKSTFLRTVGVNVLLAQCGVPVCAHSFAITPVTILSSIRINDSLQEHTSYFMAELKRLAMIIDVLEQGKPSLVLIDEVLRGTNSNDKTHGSEALIRKLTRFPALSLFASHDLALSVLEDELPGLVSNYCFESKIIDDELIFDYKLRRGVAQNKNATFLMQKMGIIS